eukprot:TRINITY_DN2126_c0_g1_i8.p1 TRINITY_DN2126_c0_g1~~TRINITY_DN2126_c0_g1_i8.p1  ORF type:complete len:302 (+),score=93.22 TRINITY_DN2126_c0_g1_i8:27-908(+)
MIRRPPRSTHCISSAASDVYKRQVGTERCMTPELFAGVNHSPVKDDIFALGYLLFILVARHPPFFAASINDEHYKLLKDNRVLEYWRAIDLAHSQRWCSDDFKHLITLMLTYDMTLRPSISETRAHPWTLGEAASEAEVVAEFEARQVSTVQYQKRQAHARKLKKAKKRDEDQETNVSRPGKAFGSRFNKRGVDEEEKVSPITAAKKIVKEADEAKKSKPTILMSEEPVPVIESTLVAFFSTNKCVKIDKKKYEVNADRKRCSFWWSMTSAMIVKDSRLTLRYASSMLKQTAS